MMTQHDLMAKWLKALGLLTAVSATEREEAKIKIDAYLSMLANRYPAQAFTKRSMEAVASRCPKGFPTYGELTAALSEWWDNAPREQIALPGPDDPSFTVKDRMEVARWQKLRANDFKELEHNFETTMLQTLSVYHRYSWPAFNYICRTDREAERIAMQRGWLEDASEQRREHTEAECDYVTAAADAVVKAFRVN